MAHTKPVTPTLISDQHPGASARLRTLLLRYGLAMLIVVLTSSAVLLLRLTIEGHVATIQLIYVLGVLLVAVLAGTGPAFLAALLSFLYASYFVVEPRYTFSMADPEQAIRLVAFLTVALLAGELAARARRQAARAEQLAREVAAAQALVESDRLKSAILSSVSHDLRTPLTTIQGAVDELTATDVDWSPQHRQQLLGTIKEQTGRLHYLVNNLLDLSRIRAGAVQPRIDWYALEEVILHTLDTQQPLLARHPVTLDLPPAMPLIPLDFVLTGQVLANLLHNAVTYAPPDTPIILRAMLTDDAVLVAVADRGPGIPAAERQHIFEPFARLAAVTDTPGSGVGLAICHGFITAQGGHIWVEENPGGGACFCFTLPRTHPTKEDTDEPEHAHHPGD
jgi:two-component system sensor histidine kinase KdpD